MSESLTSLCTSDGVFENIPESLSELGVGLVAGGRSNASKDIPFIENSFGVSD